MLKETYYICTECGFHGTDDEFNRHVLSDGYDYGHNNAAPEEVELECPDCGLYEEEGIVEAERCDFCDDWQPLELLNKEGDGWICETCRQRRGYA